jgi:hypothetical protein
MVKEKALDNYSSLIILNMKVVGVRVNIMDLGFLFQKMVHKKRENG